MKRIVFMALAGLLISATHAQDKQQETVEGNGKLVTRDVKVSSFSSLDASGVYELKLSQGAQESVKIEADENLQEYFDVRNEGDKLVIDMKKMKNKNFKSKGKMRVFVTFKNLRELQLKTVGDVRSEESLSFDHLDLDARSVGNISLAMQVKKLDLDNKSVGNLTLTGKADEAVVKNKGVGSLEAGGFVVQQMNIENHGIGSAEVNAQKELKVKDNFLGKVTNRGSGSVR